MTHTAGRCDGRQKGCESGYYNLHRNLNKTLLHKLPLTSYLFSAGQSVALRGGKKADEGVGKKMCFTVVKLTRKRLQINIKEIYS